jgi:hypothetical protein
MRRLLVFAAGLEVLTGAGLIVDPRIFTRLLFGEGVAGAGLSLGRVTGCGLLCLGLACMPGRATAASLLPAVRALLTYNLLILLLLLYLGLQGDRTGALLWPSIALHAVLSILLIVFRVRKAPPAA